MTVAIAMSTLTTDTLVTWWLANKGLQLSTYLMYASINWLNRIQAMKAKIHSVVGYDSQLLTRFRRKPMSIQVS